MTWRTVRAAFTVLALAACGGPPSAASVATVAPAPSPEAAPRAHAFSPERMMADANWLCAPERAGRGSYARGGRDAASWIAARFRELGLEVIEQAVGPSAVNVLGILRGNDEAVLVSAHYDHLGQIDGVVYPGADDNASGVAVLLELARDAIERPHRRTIVFAAFGAEEVGLIGSARYIDEPAWLLERTIAVVNFDMVGRHFFEAGAARPATAGVIGLEADPRSREVTERAARAAGLTLVGAPARLLEAFGYAYRTDEWWFRRRGIRAFHFSTGFHADYHQPSDTPDKLVPDQMVRIARTAAALIHDLVNDAPASVTATR